MITNEFNLPQPFVDAATSNHKYKPNRYSVTEVLGGTCEAVLKRRHAGEATDDVSDRLWAILGTAVHKVLETAQSAPEQHQEQWICVPVTVPTADGKKTYQLSGIFDLFDESTGTVTDWKVTSTWTVTFGDFEKWRRQVLAYCWMLRQKGYDAHRGQIVAMLRDHSQRKARTERDYPRHPVFVKEWDFTDDDFEQIGKEITWWFKAVSIAEGVPDEQLDVCSPEKRWHKPDKWAVMRSGQKRAVKLFDSEQDAEDCMEELSERPTKAKLTYSVEFRQGEDTRCQSYCSVAQFCPYGRKFLQES